MDNPVLATSSDSKVAAVKGECTGSGGFGVWGICATGHASERVKETQQVTGVTQTADAPTLKITLKADKEIYFEEGELLVPPTFDDTKLEQAKN